MTTAHPIRINDLKRGSKNNGPIDSDRAFTICGIIAHRLRADLKYFGGNDSKENLVALSIAEAIEEVAKTWR